MSPSLPRGAAVGDPWASEVSYGTSSQPSESPDVPPRLIALGWVGWLIPLHSSAFFITSCSYRKGIFFFLSSFRECPLGLKWLMRLGAVVGLIELDLQAQSLQPWLLGPTILQASAVTRDMQTKEMFFILALCRTQILKNSQTLAFCFSLWLFKMWWAFSRRGRLCI